MARRSIRKRRHRGPPIVMSSYGNIVSNAPWRMTSAVGSDTIRFVEVWRREYLGSWPNEIDGKMRVVSVDKEAGTFTVG